MTSPILDTDELAIVQSSGYEGSAYLILSPQPPIFAARVNGAVTGVISFAQITYDTVTTGAFGDILDGMDVRISRTNDIHKAYFMGRVRKLPTSSILYINETSKAVADNDYIWVVNNRPVVIKKRYKTFFDWDVTFKKPQPVVKNMDSAYASLTTAATASFSFAPIGQALAKGATIVSYDWLIPGATYTVGDDETQDITIEVDTPYNDWGRLTLTDSNGTTNSLDFTISAGDPNTDTFFRLCHDPIPLTADWANGYSTNVLFWKGFEDVLNRSRVTVVVDERLNGGTLDAISPVRFVGYLKARSSTIRGDEVHGQIKEISVEIASFLQMAGEERFDPIAVRHTTTPTAWDQINTPTPARSISHLLRHSTLLNVCAMDFGTIDDTYFSGNANIADTSLIDAEKRVASEINVYITQGGAGMLSFARDPRVMTADDRNDLPVVTPTPINLGDVFNYKLVDTGEDKVGAIEVGFAVFLTSTNTKYYLTANAPASGFDDAQGQTSVPNQLLAANSNLADAKIEGGQRTGHLLAIENTRRTLEIVFGCGWGFINPSPGEWYNFEVDAADDPNGMGIAGIERWLCVSKTMTINADGTQDVTARFTEETTGGTSLTLVSYSPAVTAAEQVVRPVRAVMGAFPSKPSINYDVPSPTTRQHRGPFDGWVGVPITPQEAAAAAANQAEPGCAVAYTNFRYSGDIVMGFLTTLDADYTITVSGRGRITQGTFEIVQDFTKSNYGQWAGDPTYWPLMIEYRDESGFFSYVGTTGYMGLNIVYTPPEPFIADEIEVDWGATGPGNVGNNNGAQFGATVIYAADSTIPIPEPLIYNTAPVTVTGGFIQLLTGSGAVGNAIVRSVTFRGGTGTTLHADAFYQWEEGADGKPFNVSLLPTGIGGIGLRQDATGLPVADNADIAVVPPFSENHEYTYLFTGTGNAVAFKYLDTDYSDNQSAPLNFKICGRGAGS